MSFCSFLRGRQGFWGSKPICTGCNTSPLVTYHDSFAKIVFVSEFKFPHERPFTPFSEWICDDPDRYTPRPISYCTWRWFNGCFAWLQHFLCEWDQRYTDGTSVQQKWFKLCLPLAGFAYLAIFLGTIFVDTRYSWIFEKNIFFSSKKKGTRCQHVVQFRLSYIMTSTHQTLKISRESGCCMSASTAADTVFDFINRHAQGYKSSYAISKKNRLCSKDLQRDWSLFWKLIKL